MADAGYVSDHGDDLYGAGYVFASVECHQSPESVGRVGRPEQGMSRGLHYMGVLINNRLR